MTFNSKVLAQEGWYISPGVQIGIDSKGNLHRSAQVTLGLLIEPFTTGLTIGYKWFRKFDKSGKKRFSPYCSVATWYLWRSIDPKPIQY